VVDALLGNALPELTVTFDFYGLSSLPRFLPFVFEPNKQSPRINTFGTRVFSAYGSICEILAPSCEVKQEYKSDPLPIVPPWVAKSVLALAKGDSILCPTGVGGTYFVLNEYKEKIALFKPIDEEPGAINNPKNSQLNPILPSGKGAFREVAAYLFDKGYAGVPETHLIQVNSSLRGLKKGSLQKFVINDGDCSDLGANKFSVEDVHRIGLFDIRSLNMDRNDENLLVQVSSEGEHKLIPIDHTYCFPEKIDGYFNWQFWSQAKVPFSSDELRYIESIDVLADANLLIANGIDETSVRNVIASSVLLKKMAQSGYTLFQIARVVSGNKNFLTEILSEVRLSPSVLSLSEFHSVVRQVVNEKLLNVKCE